MNENDEFRDAELPSSGGGMKTVLIILGVIGFLGLLCVGGGIAALIFGVQSIRKAATDLKSQSNMKQIMLAMDNYASVNRNLPLASLKSKDGKPGLSWRVTILPYIEADDLYKRFKLDEPWDSTHNIRLLNSMPPIYADPGSARGTVTHYRVFVGNGAMFDHDKPLTLEKITAFDGTANTIAVVEATDAVPWTKPDELDYNPNGPLPALGLAGKDYVLVAMADGAVFRVRKNLAPASWHKAIQYQDGQKLGDDFFELRSK